MDLEFHASPPEDPTARMRGVSQPLWVGTPAGGRLGQTLQPWSGRGERVGRRRARRFPTRLSFIPSVA
jgi:hypothetical protein